MPEPDELTPAQSAEVRDITRAQGGGVGGLSEPKFSVIAPPPAEPPAPSLQDQVLQRQLDIVRPGGAMDRAYAMDEAAAARSAAAAAASRGQLAARQKQALETPLPALHTPEYRPLPTAPVAKYREPWQALGNPLAALALVAGAFTRNSATATMNIAAAAMGAQKQNDVQAYEDARAKFKDSMDETIKANENERNAYKDSWENRKSTFDERRAQLEMWATYYQNAAMAGAARGGNVAKINAQLAGLEKTADLLTKINPLMNPNSLSEVEASIYQNALKKNGGDVQKAVAEAAPLIAQLKSASTSGRGGSTAASSKEKTMDAMQQRYEKEGKTPGEARVLAEEQYQRLLASAKGQMSFEERKELEQIKADHAKGLWSEKSAARARELEEKNNNNVELARMKIDAAKEIADDRIKANAEKQERELEAKGEAARAKDQKLTGPEEKIVTGLAGAYRELALLRESWRPEFAGASGVRTIDDFLLNLSKKGYSQNIVDQGALWWTMKSRLVDMPIRHENFGTALTAPEIKFFDQGNFDVSMSSSQIEASMDAILDFERRKIDIWTKTLTSRGVKPETLKNIFGVESAAGAPPPPPGFR